MHSAYFGFFGDDKDPIRDETLAITVGSDHWTFYLRYIDVECRARTDVFDQKLIRCVSLRFQVPSPLDNNYRPQDAAVRFASSAALPWIFAALAVSQANTAAMRQNVAAAMAVLMILIDCHTEWHFNFVAQS